MEEYYIEDDGWTVVKSGKFLVKANLPHLSRVLEAKRIVAARLLNAELARYAEDVRLVA